LTRKQETQIEAIRARAAKEIGESIPARGVPLDVEKLDTIRDQILKRALDDIVKILTPAQQAAWNSLIGAPFDIRASGLLNIDLPRPR